MTTHNYPGAILLSGLLILAAQGVSASAVTFTQYNNSSLFVDISATGTALNLTGDGVVNISTTIGNTIFGDGTVRVGNNGAIGHTSTLLLGFTNFALPSGSVFGGNVPALLPFWDDIGGTAGNVYWKELVGALIVQWHNRPHFPGIGSSTFQVQLFSSGPVLARFAYQDVDFGNSSYNFGQSATIGYQASSTEAYQFSFNSPVPANGDVIDIAAAAAVPEPASLALLGLGLAGIGYQRRKRAA